MGVTRFGRLSRSLKFVAYIRHASHLGNRPDNGQVSPDPSEGSGTNSFKPPLASPTEGRPRGPGSWSSLAIPFNGLIPAPLSSHGVDYRTIKISSTKMHRTVVAFSGISECGTIRPSMNIRKRAKPRGQRRHPGREKYSDLELSLGHPGCHEDLHKGRVPVSATIGDLDFKPGTASLAALGAAASGAQVH